MRDWLRRLFGATGQQEGTALPQSRTGSSVRGYAAYQPGAKGDWAKDAGDISQNAVVGALSTFVSKMSGEVMLKVVERDGDEVLDVEGADILEALGRHPQITDAELRDATIRSLMAYGNAYWYCVPATGGGVAFFQFLPASSVTLRTKDKSEALLSYYEYRDPNGTKYEIDPSMIQHFKVGLDPNNVGLGLSPFAAVTREIASDNLSINYSAGLIKNFGLPSAIISPGKVGDEDISFDPMTVESLKGMYRGEGAGRAALMNVPVTVSEVGMSPNDLSLGPLMNVYVTRICSAINLDPMVIGLESSSKTYSNLEEANSAAWDTIVKPMTRVLVAGVNRILQRFYPLEWNLGYRVEMDTSMVTALADDTDKLVDRANKAYISGIMTRAEARKLLGLEADPSRDDVFGDERQVAGKSLPRSVMKDAATRAARARGQEAQWAEDEFGIPDSD